jgi:hypothetical protein
MASSDDIGSCDACGVIWLRSLLYGGLCGNCARHDELHLAERAREIVARRSILSGDDPGRADSPRRGRRGRRARGR